MSNFVKIRPVGAELFHADGQTDSYDEANSGFSQFCERPKNDCFTVCSLKALIYS
jgi:hypothetical protein